MCFPAPGVLVNGIRLVVGSSVAISGSVAIDSIVAGRGGVVTRADRLVAVVADVRRSDGGASVGGVVALAVVMGTSRSSQTASGSGDGSNLRVTVTSHTVGLPALPELHARALGVAVGRTGTKALLLLVVAHEEHLEEGAEQEEDSTNDGDGEAGGVHLADSAKRSGVGNLVALAVGAKTFLGARRAIAKRSVDVARAAGCAITSHDSNSNHGTAAEEVEDYAKQSEDSLANG